MFKVKVQDEGEMGAKHPRVWGGGRKGAFRRSENLWGGVGVVFLGVFLHLTDKRSLEKAAQEAARAPGPDKEA